MVFVVEHKTERRMSVTAGLFEPTEGRGPVAPAGVPFVWGVDVSSLRVSIAVESDKLDPRLAFERIGAGDPTVRAVFTKSFWRPSGKDMGQRLELIEAGTRELARVLRARYLPEQVSVESPAMNPKGGSEPVLEYATGVVVMTLRRELCVPVWMVPVARWKARALGKGHASKAETLEWAREEFGAKIEDEADAAGACRAARLTVWEGLCDEKDVRRGAVPR